MYIKAALEISASPGIEGAFRQYDCLVNAPIAEQYFALRTPFAVDAIGTERRLWSSVKISLTSLASVSFSEADYVRFHECATIIAIHPL